MNPLIFRMIEEELIKYYDTDVRVSITPATKTIPSMLMATLYKNEKNRLIVYDIGNKEFAGGVGAKLDIIPSLKKLVLRWRNMHKS